MKNVFIEGIQGTGKSTLLSFLNREIPEFHVCRDGDYSPVDLAWCTWMTEEEYEAVLKDYRPIRDEIIKNTVKDREHFVISYTKIITDIPNFHKELEKYEVHNGRMTLQALKTLILTRYENFTEKGYLFECSFFQNVIEDLILFYQLNDDEIVDFYRELYGKIDREHFLLLYLYSDEPEETIMAIKKERCDHLGNEMWYPLMLRYLMESPYGKQHGYRSFEDMIVHFKHRQQLEMRIIREVIGDKATVLPAKDWNMDKIIEMIMNEEE